MLDLRLPSVQDGHGDYIETYVTLPIRGEYIFFGSFKDLPGFGVVYKFLGVAMEVLVFTSTKMSQLSRRTIRSISERQCR
jgi:hypothetical protein